MFLPFRKVTLDVDGVGAPVPSSAVFERQQMRSGEPRLLITAPPAKRDLFQRLVACLASPLYLLYILHTPRGEAVAGRYQSPPLDSERVGEFLATFAPYLAGDARHDTWVHSASEGRTLIWDRHDLIYAEGEPLEDITAVLGAMGFEPGIVPRPDAGSHIHYYRDEFDADAAAVLRRFDWTRSDLRPEDEQ
jgi:hypothetical protein